MFSKKNIPVFREIPIFDMKVGEIQDKASNHHIEDKQPIRRHSIQHESDGNLIIKEERGFKMEKMNENQVCRGFNELQDEETSQGSSNDEEKGKGPSVEFCKKFDKNDNHANGKLSNAKCIKAQIPTFIINKPMSPEEKGEKVNDKRMNDSIRHPICKTG